MIILGGNSDCLKSKKTIANLTGRKNNHENN